MRPGLPALLLLLQALLAAVAIPAAGQSGLPVPLLDDPTGDVRAGPAGQGQTLPGQVRPELDLVALRLQEEEAYFLVTVQVADLRLGQEDAGSDGAVIFVEFRHGGRQFQLFFVHQYLVLGEFQGVGLAYRDAEDQDWNNLWFRRDVTLDPRAETWSASVPRDDLADPRGASPYPGRLLEAFHVRSTAILGDIGFSFLGNEVASPVEVADQMPDGGPAATPYTVQLGLRQDGDAELLSDEPFRASNGEATTFLFKVRGYHHGDAPETYTLRPTKVPQGWSVVVPSPSITLEPDGSTEAAVLVSTPFTHEHGSAASFVLEMAGTKDTSSVGRIELGVRYLTIPQPAGHHNTLFLHARPYNEFTRTIGTVFSGNDGYPVMNALETMEGGIDTPLSPQNMDWAVDGSAAEATYQWCVPLDPSLQMGLDFRLRENGTLRAPVRVVAPITDARLEAQIFLAPPGPRSLFACYQVPEEERTPLATASGPAQSIDAGADAVLEATVQPLPASDKVPYVEGRNLYLFISVRGASAPNVFLAPSAPRLLPGATLELPLDEYHDDVQDVLVTSRGPALTPLGPQERKANPGATLLFPLSVANDGEEPRPVAFNVTGVNRAWATLPQPVTIAAHDASKVDLVVRVPADAKPGDFADLVVQAYDVGDEANRGLVRVLVTVDTSTTHPDDAARVQTTGTESTPGWALGMAVAAVAVAAALRRRVG